MKARVDLINEKAPGLAVSIHQNSYHEEEIHGAQVFYYSHSAEGHTAAKLMQQALLGADSENTRQEKANDTYYLLRRTQVPTIIVECGFLSNQQEAELLAGKDYQKKIAKAIATGIDEYLDVYKRQVSKQIQIPVNSSKTDTGEFFSYMKIYSISSWMLSCMIEIFFNGCSLSAVFQCSHAITSSIMIIVTIIRIIENVPFVNF